MKSRNIVLVLVLALIGFSFSNLSTIKTGTSIGDQAPELSLKGVNDETINLSDLKGKIVLIDFWASWCGPCRRENPNVIRAYKKYQKAKFHTAEGFEILSVSLDKNKAAWEAAIKKDGLFWDYHVSDLKKWNTPYKSIYKFSGIPHTVLVDRDGSIVDTKVRGAALEDKLETLFGY